MQNEKFELVSLRVAKKTSNVILVHLKIKKKILKKKQEITFEEDKTFVITCKNYLKCLV